MPRAPQYRAGKSRRPPPTPNGNLEAPGGRHPTTPTNDEGGHFTAKDNDLHSGNPGNQRGGPSSRDDKR